MYATIHNINGFGTICVISKILNSKDYFTEEKLTPDVHLVIDDLTYFKYELNHIL